MDSWPYIIIAFSHKCKECYQKYKEKAIIRCDTEMITENTLFNSSFYNINNRFCVTSLMSDNQIIIICN